MRSLPSCLISLVLCGASAALAVPLAVSTPPTKGCDADALLADARAGFARGSPALQRYLRNLLIEAALVTPNEVLLAQFDREQDPALIEALGAALAHKAETVGDARLITSLLKRAVQADDAAVRAAAVRALRGTGSVELMEEAQAGVDYRRLILDEAPAVRAAVVDNLIAEDAEVYSGHSAELAEAALAVARVAEDREAAARLLAGTSSEGLGADAARELSRALRDDHPSMRAAAARSLGGLAPSLAPAARSALVARYHFEEELEVRRAILAGLARLERARGIPLLQSLRAVDPRLSSEVDAWIGVLALGLPEWALTEREKSRR